MAAWYRGLEVERMVGAAHGTVSTDQALGEASQL